MRIDNDPGSYACSRRSGFLRSFQNTLDKYPIVWYNIIMKLETGNTFKEKQRSGARRADFNPLNRYVVERIEKNKIWYTLTAPIPNVHIHACTIRQFYKMFELI